MVQAGKKKMSAYPYELVFILYQYTKAYLKLIFKYALIILFGLYFATYIVYL